MFNSLWGRKKVDKKLATYLNTVTALDIANLFIDRALRDGKSINLLKLNKLVYIIYKEYLVGTNNKLFKEYFEVWKTGFVVNDVYTRYYSIYGSGNIDAVIGDNVLNIDGIARLFNSVWETYKDVSGIDLTEIVTGRGTAWDLHKTNELYIGVDSLIKLDIRYI